MARYMLGAWIVCALTVPAEATVSVPKEMKVLDQRPAVGAPAVAQAAAPNEFALTAETEVKLDGKPCSYQAIPPDATIILLELASDRSNAILRIHFRSKRR